MKIETLQELVDAMIKLVGKEGRGKYWTAGCAYANHSEPVVKWELYHEDYGSGTKDSNTAQEAFYDFKMQFEMANSKKKTTIKKELAKAGTGARVK